MPTRGFGRDVIMVDRAVNDLDHPRDIFHDGQSNIIPAGLSEFPIAQALAGWVYRQSEQHHIHTTDGQYVCRFGFKEAPEDFLASMGPEAGDCSPVERDLQRGEGWNVNAVGRPAMKLYGPGDIVHTINGPVRLPKSLAGLSNQGSAGSRAASGER